MLKFDLNPDEYVVMKSEAVMHGGFMSAYTDGLVLTNRSIILISRGMFGNTKRRQRLPLRDVKVIDGQPQAVASDYELEIYFRDRQESFRFRQKKEARLWAKNICALLDGSGGDLAKAKDKAIPGAEYIAESLKDTLEAVKRPFRPNPRSKTVAQGCASCGASLSGAAGQVVQCDHCGSHQKLPKR